MQHSVHMQYIASITTNKCQGPQPLIVLISRIEHILKVQQTVLPYLNKDIISYKKHTTTRSNSSIIEYW